MSSIARSSDRISARGTARRALIPLTVLMLVAAAACDGSIPAPASDITTGQAFIDLNAQLSQFREDNALLQEQIDSLRGVAAYQDTIVRQLAAAAGISMRPPAMPIP